MTRLDEKTEKGYASVWKEFEEVSRGCAVVGCGDWCHYRDYSTDGRLLAYVNGSGREVHRSVVPAIPGRNYLLWLVAASLYHLRIWFWQ